MAHHDPKKVLESLRDHLTQHDAAIAFLFGAGTSCSVRIPRKPVKGSVTQTDPLIPTVLELTAKCKLAVSALDDPKSDEKFAKAWAAMELEHAALPRAPNIEDILSCVRKKLDAMSGADVLAGLPKEDLAKIDGAIRKKIVSEVCPAVIPNSLPHDGLARWIKGTPRKCAIEIFTTNYDLLFETALEAGRVPSFDGFVGTLKPYFNHESLDQPEAAPGKGWTRLWKVHGSVNWRFDDNRGQARIIRSENVGDGELILPSHHKYDEARKQPYAAFIDRLAKVLEREDSILVTVGYSFGDNHINSVIFDALSRRKRPHVISLQFEDLADTHPLIVKASASPNLMVLCATKAMIGGISGEWRLNEPVDDRTADFMDIAFDSDAGVPEPAPIIPVSGRMKLGDFNRFCAFLSSISGTGS